VKSEKHSSRFNGVKHGIFATILLSGDNWGETEKDYLRIVSGLRRAFQPVGCFEQVQIEKLAFLYVRLSRVYKADQQFAPKLFKKVSEALDADHRMVEREAIDRESEVLVTRKDPDPDSLIRYEANVERQIVRTLDQLERFQRLGNCAPESPKETREPRAKQ
jgi:hypothetical protein